MVFHSLIERAPGLFLGPGLLYPLSSRRASSTRKAPSTIYECDTLNHLDQFLIRWVIDIFTANSNFQDQTCYVIHVYIFSDYNLYLPVFYSVGLGRSRPSLCLFVFVGAVKMFAPSGPSKHLNTDPHFMLLSGRSC